MSENNPYESLKRIKELLDAGILTQEEFNKEKAKILGNTEDAHLTDEQKARLQKIEALKEAGILTVEEFEEQRREILSAGPDSRENYSSYQANQTTVDKSPSSLDAEEKKRGTLFLLGIIAILVLIAAVAVLFAELFY